jgi:hypothetical protein
MRWNDSGNSRRLTHVDARVMKTLLRWIPCAVCALGLEAAHAFGTSPTKERFEQAIAAAHGSGADPVNRTCITFPYEPERFLGPTDTEFNWTPVAFAAHLDARSRSSVPKIERIAAMLARAGFLAPTEPLEGMPRYGLTWKGFSHSQGIRCFRFASSERKVAVRSFEKVRVQNGSDVFRVMASSVPERLEAWLDDPEFAAIYPEVASVARGSATPVEYEVALWEGRYLAIKVPGALQTSPPPRPPREARRDPPPAAQEVLKQAGKMDAARALALLKEHERQPAVQRRICLQLPTASVDETNFFEVWQKLRDAGVDVPVPVDPPLHFTVYNAGRVVDDDAQKIAYEFFRRLESVGLARSTQLPATQWKGYPARGKTRFEMTRAGTALLEPGNPGCMRVGEVSVAEVLWTTDFSVGNLRPKFFARSTFTPLPAAAPLVARMGQLRRLLEMGGASHGHFEVYKGRMMVELNHELVFFRPDPKGVRLPSGD